MDIKVNLIDKQEHLTTGSVFDAKLILENLQQMFPKSFEGLVQTLLKKEPFNIIDSYAQLIVLFLYENQSMILLLMEFNDVSDDAAIDMFREKIGIGWQAENARKFAGLYLKIQHINQSDFAQLVEVPSDVV